MSPRVARVAAAFGAAVVLSALVACPGPECPRNASCAAEPSSSPSPSASTPTTVPSSSPRSAAPIAWRRCASAPGAPRQEVTAALFEGKVFVAGGLLGDANRSASARVDAYDPSTNRWTAEPPLPIGLHHPMAATFRGKLYVLGGITQRLGGPDSARVFVFDGTRWSEGPSLKRPRGAGAAVVVHDRLIVVGGIDGSVEVGPPEIFDGTSWRDGAGMPSPLDHVGAAADGTYVYVVGGRRNGQHFTTVQRYDPRSDTWTILRSMPEHRSGLGVAFAAGRVIAAGGEGSRLFPETESFNPATGRWTRLPNMPVPRHGMGTVAIGRRVYTMLGGARVGVGPSNACEYLSVG